VSIAPHLCTALRWEMKCSSCASAASALPIVTSIMFLPSFALLTTVSPGPKGIACWSLR
jgi:hypothetical protein